MSNVSLIFDAKKDEPLNYSWFHYCEHPEMKKFLKNVKDDNGNYSLIDERTGNIVLSSSMCLQDFLNETNSSEI